MSKNWLLIVVAALFSLFFLWAKLGGYEPGVAIGDSFIYFAFEMIRIVPFAFILIGLFEVWVKREVIERHLGDDSGPLAYVYAVLLAGMTVGGAYVAFPVAYALWKKGAALEIILTYIGASAIVRVPMTIFEASFLGVKFSLIRLLISIPLVVLSSISLGKYLRGYPLPERDD